MCMRWRQQGWCCLAGGSCLLPSAGERGCEHGIQPSATGGRVSNLGQLGGYNVLVDPAVTGEVSFVLRDLTLEEALDLVTKTTGYGYELVGNTLVISTAQRLKTEFGTEDVRFVSIKHVDVQDAQRLVQLVVPGVSYVDPELNLLVLTGSPPICRWPNVCWRNTTCRAAIWRPRRLSRRRVQAPEPAPPGRLQSTVQS